MQYKEVTGGICAPKGFAAAGVHCGIRANHSEKYDLALIKADVRCAAAGVYTTNKVCGAPIKVDRAHLADGYAQAIVVNSGNANTCAANGVALAEECCELVGKALDIDAMDVLPASTGVIGQPMVIDPFARGIPAAAAKLAATEQGSTDAATAIMTTDTHKKEYAIQFELGGKMCTVGVPENCMVTNATGAYGLAISEWMLAMWLGIQKDMFLYRDRQNQRQWAPIDRPVRGITGARVLCVGMGDIGSNFARRAHMLGAEVVGVRRTVHPDTPCPDYCLRVVAQSQLDEELPEADLIALSLPGTPETNKLFNAERFARCKDGAILINVGRGTTVDSDALVEALRSGKIFGAGLDVTDPEPLPADHPLWGEPGAIITPHNSGKFSLPKTLDNIVDIFIHNLKRYADGLPLDNQVNRTTRYAADQNGGHRLLSTL